VSPSCQLRPPSLITTYRLTPPSIKPPKNSYISPSRSEVTLHYLLHVTLHYNAYTYHPRQQRHMAQSDNDKCQDEIDISGVITEISSANGYKNSTLSNNYEVIHGPELTQKHSQRVKTIQLVKKLKGSMKTQGTCAHVKSQNAEIMNMRTMHECCRKNPHT
jgi:hypothetical protein